VPQLSSEHTVVSVKSGSREAFLDDRDRGVPTNGSTGSGLAVRQFVIAREAGPRRKVFLAARSPRRRAALP